jgi:hypothetical protein
MRTARILALALASALLASCGITSEATPRPIDLPSGFTRSAPSPTPAPTGSGPVVEKLYLVRDSTLVPVTRHVDHQPNIGTLLNNLQTGPTTAEAAAGLTSALTGSDLVTGARLRAGGIAIVELATTVDNTVRNDEVLAYAQLVCTLVAQTNITGVTFTHNGQPVAVPRGDGSLPQTPDTPLTAADYATLITNPTPTPQTN